jgi:hypothetical protein
MSVRKESRPSLWPWGDELAEWSVHMPDGSNHPLLSSPYIHISWVWGEEWPPLILVAAIDRSWTEGDSDWWLPDWAAMEMFAWKAC